MKGEPMFMWNDASQRRLGFAIARRSRRVQRFCLTLLVCAALAAFFVSCAGEKTEPEGPNPRLPTVELKIGTVSIKAEVAKSPRERERGLMFRSSLADGSGMLFVFETDQRLSFWMKNTKIPLSIAFISSNGVIRQIADLEPLSLAPVQSERSVRYALEVPRGWFSRAGVGVGDRVDLSVLD